jgi:hypothetical protein
MTDCKVTQKHTRRRKKHEMTTEMETRTTRLTVAPKDEPIFSEQAILVEIVDEAAGEYVTVTALHGGPVSINPEEWPALRDAIDRMIADCREERT